MSDFTSELISTPASDTSGGSSTSGTNGRAGGGATLPRTTRGMSAPVAPAEASELPRIDADPRSLRFSAASGEESAALPVRLTNNGSVSFQIEDLALDDEDRSGFVVYGVGSDIAPGQSMEIGVAFRPHPRRSTSDRLRVVGNGGAKGASITLRGKVVSAEKAQEGRANVIVEQARQWRYPSPPRTYEAMLDALTAASELMDGPEEERPDPFDYTHARELSELVVRELDEVASFARIAELKRKLDLNGMTQQVVDGRIGNAKLAARTFLDRSILKGSINGAYTLNQFKAGCEEILLLTGEKKPEGSELKKLDEAADTALKGHLVGYGAAIAAPVVAALAIEAAPVLAAEMGIVSFAAKEAFAGVTTWALANPGVALELAGIALSLGVEIGENGIDAFLARLETPEGVAGLAFEMLVNLLTLHQAQLEWGPAGGRSRAPQVDAAEPDVPHVPAGLPPKVAQSVAAQPPAATEQVARAVREVTDRLGSFIEAVRSRRQGVQVPRERARGPVPEGVDSVVESGTLGEHYDHARHRRAADRASRGDDLYEAKVDVDAETSSPRANEGAMTVGRLQAAGGDVRARHFDPFTGHVLIEVRMPNGRRIQVHEARAGGPRVTLPRDRAEASRLRVQAEQARQALAAADEAMGRQVLALADAQGEVNHLFGRGILGGGTASVIDHATLPEMQRGPASAGTSLPDVITVSAAPEPWSTRSGEMGQPPQAYAQGRAPGDEGAWGDIHQQLLTDPVAYTPAPIHADALDLTRVRTGQRTLYGWKVRTVSESREPTWLRQDATVRVTLEGSDGTPLVLYFGKVDLTMGPGPGRRLDASQLGARPGAEGAVSPAEAQRAASVESQLEGDGRLTYGDEQLSQPRAGRVLVSGGGATAAWNASAVTQAGGSVKWIGRRANASTLPADQKAEHAANSRELAQMTAAMEAPNLDSRARARLLTQVAHLEKRQEDIETFSAAMFARNNSVFEDPAIERAAVGIKRISPSEQATIGEHAGEPGKVFVEFTDGSAEYFDQVVVSHGLDAAAPGGVVNVTAQLGQMSPIRRGDEVVGLQSESGNTRVLGAAGWQKAWERRMSDEDALTFAAARQEQAGELEPYSRGVADSVAMAGRTIPAANSVDGGRP